MSDIVKVYVTETPTLVKIVTNEGSMIYIAYAEDNLGNGFSLTPTINSKYIAFLKSNLFLQSLEAIQFDGLWTMYKSEAGGTIISTEIDANGDLIVTYSDGIIVNVGHVVGADGADGDSAYQSYLNTTTDNPPLTEQEWSNNSKKIIEKTYIELVSLVSDNGLIVGQKYLITDNQRTYTQYRQSGNIEKTAEIEPIIVTGLTANTFEPIAYSTLFPQDILYYSFENDHIYIGVGVGSTTGYISRRIDTKKNLDISFDFRNILFYRDGTESDLSEGEYPFIIDLDSSKDSKIKVITIPNSVIGFVEDVVIEFNIFNSTISEYLMVSKCCSFNGVTASRIDTCDIKTTLQQVKLPPMSKCNFAEIGGIIDDIDLTNSSTDFESGVYLYEFYTPPTTSNTIECKYQDEFGAINIFNPLQ